MLSKKKTLRKFGISPLLIATVAAAVKRFHFVNYASDVNISHDFILLSMQTMILNFGFVNYLHVRISCVRETGGKKYLK